MGGRGGSSGIGALGPVGQSSPNGEMKRVTLYHGSFADFDQFDRSKNSKEGKSLFLSGYHAMVERLHPETIIFYGSIPTECRGNIVQIKAFQEKFSAAKMEG